MKEVKLTVKSKDGTHEKWVCSICAQGDNPWHQSHDDTSYHSHQDDIEEAFVVKQYYNISLRNMVLIFKKWRLKRRSNVRHVI